MVSLEFLLVSQNECLCDSANCTKISIVQSCTGGVAAVVLEDDYTIQSFVT
jgi:hypothetical protein